jgi:glycosyltransferase involved in cell wall biosynthesis
LNTKASDHDANHVQGVCYVAVDVVVPYYKGSSTHIVEVGKNLSRMGMPVFVLSRRLGPWQRSTEYVEGIEISRVYRGMVGPLPRRSSSVGGTEDGSSSLGSRVYRMYLSTAFALFSGLAAARIVKRHNLQAIIERETSLGAGALASLITGRPLILEVNGPRISPISIRRASRITAYSNSMVGEEARKKTTIVDAGVNLELFRPDREYRAKMREKYNLGDSPVVSYVGSFQTWHGVDDLVRASQSVIEVFPNAKFLMVGPGFGPTRRLAEEMGVSDAFIFTGPVPYNFVPQYVNAADILVSPTDPSKSAWTLKHGPPEQFKIFEYMACRKPVIATSIGPMLRIVKDGVTGITVAPGDFRALSEAIIKLTRDPKLADDLAENAYRATIERYSWSRHANEVHGIVLSAMRDRA